MEKLIDNEMLKLANKNVRELNNDLWEQNIDLQYQRDKAETKLQQIREYCEETVNRNKKELSNLEALPPEEYKVNESWNEYHKGYYLAEKELCEGFLEILNSGGAE